MIKRRTKELKQATWGNEESFLQASWTSALTSNPVLNAVCLPTKQSLASVSTLSGQYFSGGPPAMASVNGLVAATLATNVSPHCDERDLVKMPSWFCHPVGSGLSRLPFAFLHKVLWCTATVYLSRLICTLVPSLSMLLPWASFQFLALPASLHYGAFAHVVLSPGTIFFATFTQLSLASLTRLNIPSGTLCTHLCYYLSR